MSVQLECGELRKSGDQLRGMIRLGSRLAGELLFSNLARTTISDNAPSYDVFYKPEGEAAVVRPIGQAWLKNSDKVEGGDFLSITLDDPDWHGAGLDAINLSAFPREDGKFRIVWSRPRSITKPKAAAA